jgi:threonine dehydratase
LPDFPSLEEMRSTAQSVAPFVRRTPCIEVRGADLGLGVDSPDFVLKLEMLQVTGTFKPRGALSVMLNLTAEQRARGVTAVSAGNHAIAVAYAARALGTTAKIVVMKSINPARLARARSYGAEIEIAQDGATAFARAHDIEATEGRSFVHPFEGPRTVAGAAGVGLEWLAQSDGLDAVIIAVGGGGLIAGVAAAVKQASPAIVVYGVEPDGADSLTRSLAAGRAMTLPPISTIADSLAPPMTTPYTFGVCQRFVDSVVCIPDADMRKAMGLAFSEFKLCLEPAGAAALAAALGSLRERLAGARRVGVLVCGSNIDLASYAALVNA